MTADEMPVDAPPTDASGPSVPQAPSGDDAAETIPELLPVLPVRNHVAFPGTVMPINVGREKSKTVLDLALAGDKLIGVFAQRSDETEDPKLDDLYRIGTACRILKLFKLPDGTETIIVSGIARVGIESITRQAPYLEAKVNAHHDTTELSTELEALMHNVRHAADRIMELSPNVPDEAKVVLDNIESPGGLADFLAANLSLSLVYRQELLETFDVNYRLRKVYAALTSQLEVLELSTKLDEQVRSQMDRSQREYYLREQLKAIQSELGQADRRTGEIERLTQAVTDAKMPEDAAQAAKREIERLEVIPQASPEYSVALDYVEWLTSLPWSVRTEDNLDLTRAEKVLHADHYGLAKIKRRIVEFLAVRKLNPAGKGSILCFAGPPGVGKTSLGRSIARAMERKFIRLSLGGVRDEAEIRGHRRTYIGAMPGRIVQEIRKCGASNPVFMLDEVDKIGSDFRGDPASALLEVLDPAQNDTFTDHYLDVPLDLSNVLFIATANYMDMVPHALADRMEVLELSSYTRHEKLQIAKNYLAPRQLVQNGLAADKVQFTDDAIRAIIAGYTRESGVRELERQIGAVCRAVAAGVVRGEIDRKRVTPTVVKEVLGPVDFISEIAARDAMPGVVTGLAYTTVGGEILFVEALRLQGSGSFSLTGQIGDVMRESAQAALSLVRSRCRKLRINVDTLVSHDLHIHVPGGAVPKDGPSAGVAMFVAIAAALKEAVVDPRLAMTGEITLRGSVLPVGGIKEKVLAAHRAGIERVILPAINMKDLHEVPDEVREDLEFLPVKTIDELLPIVFKSPRRKTSSAKKTATRKAASKKTAKKKTTKKKTGQTRAKVKRKRPAPPRKKVKKVTRRRAATSRKSTT